MRGWAGPVQYKSGVGPNHVDTKDAGLGWTLSISERWGWALVDKCAVGLGPVSKSEGLGWTLMNEGWAGPCQ